MTSISRVGPLSVALLVAAVAHPAAAQTVGSCLPGVAEAELNASDVVARVFNTGALFFGNATDGGAGYTVPRGAPASALFVSSLWVGGRVGGEVRVAAAEYMNYNFWPGPLDAGAVLPNPTDCSAFDRIYTVSARDVAAYEAGGAPSADLSAWPVGLGAPAVTATGAPVVPTSREQTIDLAAGERPVVYGSQTAFWVMNDVGNVHAGSTSEPLGIEVRVSAFGIADPQVTALQQATVYRYTVVNRNAQPIEDAHVSFFSDPDVGDHTDDYAGTDPARSLAFGYNADNSDVAYGTAPPAIGFDLLGGAASGMYLVNSAFVGTADPDLAAEYYSVMQGLWRDGTTMRAYGDGYAETQGAVTTWAFPGDPAAGAFWSERNPFGTGTGTPNTPADRRVVLSTPPFSLAPGASRTVDVAVVFGQGTTNLTSVTALRSASDAVQVRYDAGALFATVVPPAAPAQAPALVSPANGATFTEGSLTFSWSAVAGATGYMLERSRTADFADPTVTLVAGTSVTFGQVDLPGNVTDLQYWRVRARNVGGDGPLSEVRAYRYYFYRGGPLVLANGGPAFVEVLAPGGLPACDGPSDGSDGCAETGGHYVWYTDNSTGRYGLAAAVGAAGPEASVGAFGPSEFEVRFTGGGSVAYNGITGTTRRLSRVPFEVWDVGRIVPGQPNDPADDVQLVAGLTSASGIAGTCGFEFGDLPGTIGFPQSVGATDRIYAYYPTTTYAAWEAAAGAFNPDACPQITSTGSPASFVDVSRRPLQRVVFEGSNGTTSVSELNGAVVRFYTVDPVTAADDVPAASGAVALQSVFPNPARGVVTVAYTASGPVRLRVVDVLGRTVAVVAEGTVAAGAHEARLDTRALAPGVYAVVLDAGGERAVRTLTVVR